MIKNASLLIKGIFVTIALLIVLPLMVQNVSAELPPCDPKDSFCDSQKVNEYVSWYLNGTIYRAEYESLYGPDPRSQTKLTTFSGPLNKRLPLAYWDLMRIQSIENYTDPPLDEDTGEPLPQNHNQIVVCAHKYYLFFGSMIPHPCYSGGGAAASPQVYRFEDWEGDLSLLASAANWAAGTDVWNSRKPPLPWGLDQEGNPMTDLKYRKYYNEWRGNTCIVISILGGESLICIDNPLVTNEYADLFPYIPMSNTVDKNALHLVAGAQLNPNPGTIAYYDPSPDGDPLPPATNEQLDGDNPDIVHEPVLFYPHTKETVQLSDMLNKMFSPLKCEDRSDMTEEECQQISAAATSGTPSVQDYEELGCEFIEVRSNPGDRLFQSSQDSRLDDLAVYVDIEIDAIGCPAGPIDAWREACGCEDLSNCPTHPYNRCLSPSCNPLNCTGCIPGVEQNPYPSECARYPGCSGTIGIKIPTTPKIPYADEIRESTVISNESTFRRIFPKIEEGAPVDCIADIPGTTTTQYAPMPDPGYTPLQSVETPLAVNPAKGPASVVNSELYFPYQGTIYEYFLRGIQTALRPKGYGHPIPNGTECNLVCGELPEFEQPAAGCELKSGSVRGTQIPKSLAEILEAAGSTFNVTPQLIVAILFGEGAFNPARGNSTGQGYDWTEANVLNWASCTGLPSCSGPETSLVGFIPVYWESEAKEVLDELQEIDPTITEVDPCNLWHVIFTVASMIHGMAGGGVDLAGKSCFGITMGSYYPTSCSEWDAGSRGDSMTETAIRAWEYGSYWDPTTATSLSCPVAGACNCATIENGCAIGGFPGSACLTPGDGCEKRGSGNTSHNACLWDVAHGN